MKYIAKFDLKNNVIRSDYRPIFISFFKKAISEYMNGHFFDSLYSEDPKKKNFCWSIKLDNPKFDGDKIHLGSNNLEMTFKTDDNEVALIYFSSLMNMKDKFFNIGDDNQLILRNIRMVRDPDIVGDFGVFKILSPVCIRIHDRETNKDDYLSVEDEDFEKEFRQKLKEDLDYLDEEINSLEFDFSNLKKVIVPTYGIKISANIGTFFVRGNNEVINRIKTRGIGSRRGSGFGLIESIY